MNTALTAWGQPFWIAFWHGNQETSCECEAIEWVKPVTKITLCEAEIIMHSRPSLPSNGGSNWVKQDGTDFNVTIGSYDGAEVCGLVGLNMLQLSVLTCRISVYTEMMALLQRL